MTDNTIKSKDKSEASPYDKYFTVLMDHPDFLAINKAPGVNFQTVGNKEGVLELIRRAEEEGYLKKGERLFPVHRLDQVTSGILLFARSRKNANQISNEFRFNRVDKFYIALADRRPKKKQGRVSGDMERGRRGGWILNRTHSNPAVTDFKSKSIPGRRPGLRLYILKPRTGRTHQIRVAMKSLGAPILGDHLYGRFDQAREEDRAYLHAFFLRFKLGDAEHTLLCPPGPGFEFDSKEFQKAMKEYGDPMNLGWAVSRGSR